MPNNFSEKIERTRIPDEDMPNWIGALREGGLSDKEIDSVLARLNKTYREKKGIDIVGEEVEKIREYIFKKHQRILTPEQIKYIRQGVEAEMGD